MDNMICAPIVSSSSGDIAFTVACVPTGMNAGVSTAPCGSSRRPRRARPEVLCIVNFIRTASSFFHIIAERAKKIMVFRVFKLLRNGSTVIV